MAVRQQLGLGVASKPKAENPKQHFQDKNTFFESREVASCISYDQQKDTGVVHQLTKTAIFIATLMKKYIQQFILLKVISFFQFVDRKVVGLMSKYYLYAADTTQVSIFFLIKDKNE